MRKVRINRKTWRSGGSGDFASGKGDTNLLNNVGYMCCLGFTVHQLVKCSKSKIEGYSQPGDLYFQVSPLTTPIDHFHTQFTSECIDINDNRYINREERESKLISKFKEQDLELEFYGEY